MKWIWLSFALTLAACGPGSIDDLCEEAATAQCEQCYACGDDGAALCALPSGTSQDDCVTDLAFGCGDQSATVEEAKKDLQACKESLETLTCDVLIASEAQGGPSSTPECEYFL